MSGRAEQKRRAAHVRDAVASASWEFLVNVCWDHQEDKMAYRVFKNEKAARAWVEHEHETRWDEAANAFKTVPGKVGEYDVRHSLGFEIADLYRILPSGEVEEVDQYQTFAGENGNAVGWIGK